MSQQNTSTRTPAGNAVTDLILETFRLNGQLLDAGDRLVADLGLTSARWQVLGAVAMSPVPLPVAYLARNMGLARQSVQRIVNDMEKAGIIRLAPNPHHQRAKLVLLTEDGEALYRAASERQARWSDALAQDLDSERIEAAALLLRDLRQRLEGGSSAADQADSTL